MRKLLLFLLLCNLPLLAQVKEKEKEEILAEGLILYNSEKASWHGTDIFLAKFPDKKEKAGGYFSYSDGTRHTCIFFDNGKEPGVLASFTFNDNFVVEAAEVSGEVRAFTNTEKDLYTIRTRALELSRSDTLFKRYNNTNLNFIPIITKKEKKVYALTGPSVTGVVVFGNDYLITFDKKNNIKEAKKLHNNIIPIDYSDNQNEETTMHSHNHTTGDLITPTDVCTLMLYGPYTHWKQHIVISQENVCIWDCTRDELFIMTREAWEKIYGDSKGEKTNGKE